MNKRKKHSVSKKSIKGQYDVLDKNMKWRKIENAWNEVKEKE